MADLAPSPAVAAAQSAGRRRIGPAQEWARGWPAVGGAMLGIAAGMNMFFVTSGFFVKPLVAEFGWSRGQVALFAVTTFICGLLVPVTGAIADRYGSRILVAVGSLMFAACYLAFAGMTGAYWQYLVILAIIGLVCGPATVPFVFLRPVAVAFDRSRGFAMAVAMSGFPLLSFALLPALQYVISTQGWRVGFLCLAPLALALGAASWLLLARAYDPHRPVAGTVSADRPRATDAPGLSLRQVLVDPRFWLLALAMVAVNVPVGIFVTTLQPMLSDRGVDGRTAAFLGAWQGAVTVVARISFGALVDRFWPPLIGAIALGAPLFGLLIFIGAGSQVAPLAAAIALVAVAFGAESDLLAYFTSRYFGLRAFGAVLGALGVFYGLSVSLGSIIAGFMFDRFGTYQHVLIGGAALSAVAAAAILASGLVGRSGRPGAGDGDLDPGARR
jgi:MFS family permease